MHEGYNFYTMLFVYTEEEKKTRNDYLQSQRETICCKRLVFFIYIYIQSKKSLANREVFFNACNITRRQCRKICVFVFSNVLMIYYWNCCIVLMIFVVNHLLNVLNHDVHNRNQFLIVHNVDVHHLILVLISKYFHRNDV